MRLLEFVVLTLTLGATFFFSGCNACSPRQNPDELREKTAKTTAMLKEDAKAVAQGVREGLSKNDVLNLNTASAKQLATLPGITSEQADRIVANRPYSSPAELVSKRILSRREYNKIKDRITVRK